MSVYFRPNKKVESADIEAIPLPQFAKNYLTYLSVEKNLAPRTIFTYGVSVVDFLRWVRYIKTSTSRDKYSELDVTDLELEEISAFTRNDIAEYLHFCNFSLGNDSATRAKKLSAVKSLFNYLVKSDMHGELKANPALDVATPKLAKKLPVYLSVEEAQKLIKAAGSGGETPARDQCMIFMFLSSGLRLNELVMIDLNDIKEGVLRVHGKGRKERMLYLSRETQELIDNYMIEREGYRSKHDKNALFLSPRTGKRLTGRRVEQIVESNMKKAGLPASNYHVHSLRHSFATELYLNDMADVVTLQALLGHTNLNTTKRYVSINGEQVKSSMKQAGSLFAIQK